jgi:type I restriction enzyme S subunit
VGQWDLRWEDFKQIRLTYPPLPEQDRIVTFLDEKTAQIDTLIAKKRRQIELLDEQKAILINRAVTRGLTPNAELVDSGIEWIGRIPKGWGISRLKHECSNIVDCPHATPVYEPDGEYPAIRTSDVSPGETHYEQAKRVGAREFARWTERLTPRPGDILYSREGDWGISAPVPEGVTLCISQRMMVFRPNKRIYSPYLMWQLNCEHVLRQGFFDVLGSTVPHVNIGTIANYQLVIPPRKEQERIAEHVTSMHSKFKEAKRQIQSQIQTLQSLRSTLIAHAVTGQIRV